MVVYWMNSIYGVSNGRYMGNTNSAVSSIWTYGLDCSGFVCVVYQLGGRYYTSSMVGSGYPFYAVSSAPGSPITMDILNHSGDHVFIFDTSFYINSVNYWGLYECTTTYNYRGGAGSHADKTVYANSDVDTMNLTGYVVGRLNGW